jgi:hypothetical protein
MKCLMSILTLVVTVCSQSIVPSKDSLWVCNSQVFSRDDAVVITNTTSGAVWIDSVRIEFEILDTVGVSYAIADNRIETVWSEKYKRDSTMFYTWTMVQVGVNKFRLTNTYEGTSIRKPGTIESSGDSISIHRMQIGFCFECNSLPRYPKYLRGMMFLYFNGNRTVSLRLYSNDLRPVNTSCSDPVFHPVAAKPNPGWFLINGRVVADGGTAAVLKHHMHRLYSATPAKR